MNKSFAFALIPLAAVALSACSGIGGTDYDKAHADVVAASFQPNGIATLDYLTQDESNRLCSAADVAGKALDEKTVKAIEAAEMKTIKWPTDGKFLGDWKKGEAIAQSGRGLTWSDTATTVNGGNCYNCHQMDKKEISFGNLGPSLYNYGKLRGVTDPDSAAAKPIVEYTWGKLWNSRAYNACSQMPRAGHKGILTQAQLQDVMALLLDPKSPVNQ
jgi:L-cysteine S-thiosulfotransferase